MSFVRFFLRWMETKYNDKKKHEQPKTGKNKYELKKVKETERQKGKR